MKTKLNTGVEITYNKKGNIRSIKTPHDNDTMLQSSMDDILYSEHLSNQLKSMFNAFNDAFRFGGL